MPTKRNKDTDKVLVSWENRHQEVITRSIKTLMDIIQLDDKGKPKCYDSIQLLKLLTILSIHVKIKGVNDTNVRWHLLYRAAFNRLKKYSVQDLRWFRTSVAAEARNYLNKPVSRYSILFPLHVTQFPENTYTLLGNRLHISSWKRIREDHNLELESFWQAFTANDPNKELPFWLRARFTPILITSDNTNQIDAINSIEKTIDLFRTHLNMLYLFGVTRLFEFNSGFPKPLSKILPSPLYVVFNDKGHYQDYYQNDLFFDYFVQGRYKTNSISQPEIQRVQNSLSFLNATHQKQETMDLMISALYKYGEALDAIDWRLAFLLLWQVLELVTFQASDQFNMKTVLARITTLLGSTRDNKDILNILHEARNRFVHEGIFPTESAYQLVDLLKEIVERVLYSLLTLSTDYPTKSSLSHFYEYSARSDSDLATRKETIDTVLRARGNQIK